MTLILNLQFVDCARRTKKLPCLLRPSAKIASYKPGWTRDFGFSLVFSIKAIGWLCQPAIPVTRRRIVRDRHLACFPGLLPGRGSRPELLNQLVRQTLRKIAPVHPPPPPPPLTSRLCSLARPHRSARLL